MNLRSVSNDLPTHSSSGSSSSSAASSPDSVKQLEEDVIKSLCEWAAYNNRQEIVDACGEYFEAHNTEVDESSRLALRLLFFGCRKHLFYAENVELSEESLSDLSSFLSRIISSFEWMDNCSREVPFLTSLKYDAVVQLSLCSLLNAFQVIDHMTPALRRKHFPHLQSITTASPASSSSSSSSSAATQISSSSSAKLRAQIMNIMQSVKLIDDDSIVKGLHQDDDIAADNNDADAAAAAAIRRLLTRRAEDYKHLWQDLQDVVSPSMSVIDSRQKLVSILEHSSFVWFFRHMRESLLRIEEATLSVPVLAISFTPAAAGQSRPHMESLLSATSRNSNSSSSTSMASQPTTPNRVAVSQPIPQQQELQQLTLAQQEEQKLQQQQQELLNELIEPLTIPSSAAKHTPVGAAATAATAVVETSQFRPQHDLIAVIDDDDEIINMEDYIDYVDDSQPLSQVLPSTQFSFEYYMTGASLLASPTQLPRSSSKGRNDSTTASNNSVKQIDVLASSSSSSSSTAATTTTAAVAPTALPNTASTSITTPASTTQTITSGGNTVMSSLTASSGVPITASAVTTPISNKQKKKSLHSKVDYNETCLETASSPESSVAASESLSSYLSAAKRATATRVILGHNTPSKSAIAATTTAAIASDSNKVINNSSVISNNSLKKKTNINNSNNNTKDGSSPNTAAIVALTNTNSSSSLSATKTALITPTSDIVDVENGADTHSVNEKFEWGSCTTNNTSLSGKKIAAVTTASASKPNHPVMPATKATPTSSSIFQQLALTGSSKRDSSAISSSSVPSLDKTGGLTSSKTYQQEEEEEDDEGAQWQQSKKNRSLLSGPRVSAVRLSADIDSDEDITSVPTTSQPPKGRKKWTYEEEEALTKGFYRYGNRWVDILADPELSKVLKSRTNVNLKDKARQLNLVS